MAEYVHPEALVSTQWVAEHGQDQNVRLVEVDVDTAAYNTELNIGLFTVACERVDGAS